MIDGGAFSLVEDLGAIDATIRWAIDAHPADHYVLVIWDHGGAWQGAISDEHHGRQLMPALELCAAQALEARDEADADAHARMAERLALEACDEATRRACDTEDHADEVTVRSRPIRLAS